jgi:small subunit ribosomal protein S6
MAGAAFETKGSPMQHCYETIFILHPDLSDEDVDAAKGRVEEAIAGTGGRIYRRENWGKKRLAYTVAKQQRGIYQLCRYIGSGQTVADLERMFRLDEAFIKFLTVRLKQDPATAEAQAEEADARAAEEKPARGDDKPRGRRPAAREEDAEPKAETKTEDKAETAAPVGD